MLAIGILSWYAMVFKHELLYPCLQRETDVISRLCFLSTVIVVLGSFPGAYSAEHEKYRELAVPVFKDKIRGGWAGKMIGVSYGYPTEFKSLGKIYEKPIPWTPEQVHDAIDQDDLYVGMTFAETMDREGLDATTEQYGEALKNSKYKLWHANAGARRLLQSGIKAPLSGHPKYNIHANDIDFQIEADFMGLMCPGLPQASNRYCDRVGHVMNYGDGVYGGMFICGMFSAAYFETDPRAVVEAGLACLPAESEYAQLIQDVLDWHKENPDDWRKTWEKLEHKWDHGDCCVQGAMVPFNIDAKINGGYVALGLLYGNGNMDKTIEVSTRAGQDSDCNPSSAAGILGVMIGYEAIPDHWKSGIPAIADTKFKYTDSSLNDVCQSTFDRAVQVIQLEGGQVSDDRVLIPVQSPVPAKFEQWSMGKPVKRIGVGDKELRCTGKWETEQRNRYKVLRTKEAGADFAFDFEGTAVLVGGEHSPEGGLVDVYLDGKKVATVDTYLEAMTFDNSIWHVYGLEPGKHSVRLVALGKSGEHSAGTDVILYTAAWFE